MDNENDVVMKDRMMKVLCVFKMIFKMNGNNRHVVSKMPKVKVNDVQIN